MPIPWRPAAAFVMVLLAVSCGSGDPGASAAPFAQFVRDVQAARYADYAGRPGVAVRDEQAFEQMRRYLLARYLGARVVSSYVVDDAVFDCMPPATAAGVAVAPKPPPPPGSSSPGAAGTVAPARQEQGCPAGTVPVRRVTLGQLVRFATLRSFLGKSPGGGGIAP